MLHSFHHHHLEYFIINLSCLASISTIIISSPITLEYAEELLLMADTGRCAVLDVSEVPKERPTGHNDNNGDGDDKN